MNKRIYKKKVKKFIDIFAKEKLPAAFASKKDLQLFVNAWARRQVGQSYHFPVPYDQLTGVSETLTSPSESEL